MASDAEKYQKKLDDELKKPFPDPDVVYALKTTSPYWNTIDTSKVKRGFEKIRKQS